MLWPKPSKFNIFVHFLKDRNRADFCIDKTENLNIFVKDLTTHMWRNAGLVYLQKTLLEPRARGYEIFWAPASFFFETMQVIF